MIKVVAKDSFVYNAKDKKGFERGFNDFAGGPGNPAGPVARIYSVYKIKNGLAHCQSCGGWGMISEETVKIDNLEPYPE